MISLLLLDTSPRAVTLIEQIPPRLYSRQPRIPTFLLFFFLIIFFFYCSPKENILPLQTEQYQVTFFSD